MVFVIHAAGGVVFALARRLSAAVELPSSSRPRSEIGPHRSRSTVLAVAGLFAMDAFGGGLIVQSVVAYWLVLRFGASEGAVGALVFGMGMLAACSAPAPAWLAGRLGLVRTMVFTHAPSNLLLCLLPFCPTFAWVVTGPL
jgi:predicted MFS family arabinose efflux permease